MVAIALEDAAKVVQGFTRRSNIPAIEHSLTGAQKTTCKKTLEELGVTPLLLGAALTLKREAGQINVLIHAVGMLWSLPFILEDGETIEALSLGAGNTGKRFDLETDRRVAEFTFVDWKGRDAMRLKQLFEDFYKLAEHDASKDRYLYVKGRDRPLKFLKGRRKLSSIMDRNQTLWNNFHQHYANRFTHVEEYYHFRKERVQIVDLTAIVPNLENAL